MVDDYSATEDYGGSEDIRDSLTTAYQAFRRGDLKTGRKLIRGMLETLDVWFPSFIDEQDWESDVVRISWFAKHLAVSAWQPAHKAAIIVGSLARIITVS